MSRWGGWAIGRGCSEGAGARSETIEDTQSSKPSGFPAEPDVP